MSNFIDIWVEQGKQEAFKEGHLDGLEVALDYNFGIEGLRLMLELHNINNVEILQSLRSAKKTANSNQELRSI